MAATASVVGNVVILLAVQLFTHKNRAHLISDTLLQNYFNFFSIGAIVLLAAILCYFTGIRPFNIAILMVSIFPVLMILEGHNLWFLEIIAYFIMGVPPFIGALIGYRIRNRGNDSSALTSGSTADRDKSWWGF